MFKTRLLAVLNLFTYIGTLTINFLANYIPINNLTTGEVAALYPNLFTPAGITFSIWGLIYTLMGIFTIYQLLAAFNPNSNKGQFISKIGLWNFILGLGNMIWILTWHYLFIGLSVIVILIMLASLVIIYINLGIGIGFKSRIETYLVDINFSIYLGWISIATIANIASYLVSINWTGLGISPAAWTIIVMGIGILLGLYFINKYKDIFYGLVISWALLGIYLKRVAEAAKCERFIMIWSLIGISIISISVIMAIIKKNIYVFQTK